MPSVLRRIGVSAITFHELSLLSSAFGQAARNDTATVVHTRCDAALNIGAFDVLDQIAHKWMRPDPIIAPRAPAKHLPEDEVANLRPVPRSKLVAGDLRP